MKAFIKASISFIVLLLIAFNIEAQTVKKDSSGNYRVIKSSYFSTKDSTIKPTGKLLFDAKGDTFPIFVTKSGKLFVVKTAKTSGNKYRSYLKID